MSIVEYATCSDSSHSLSHGDMNSKRPIAVLRSVDHYRSDHSKSILLAQPIPAVRLIDHYDELVLCNHVE
jgi:hypothetical protein